MKNTKNKSGFEDDKLWGKACQHPSHNPPNHIHIPVGKIYRHVCPCCGEQQVIKPLYVTL